MSEPRMPTDRIANLLYAGAGMLLVYALLVWLGSLPAFALHQIEVRGELRHVSAEQVGLLARREVRGNFFTVDLEDVRTAFEKLDWVSEARISRRWPDTLVVELVEHVPLANWNDSGLLSTEGAVFNAGPQAGLPALAGFEGSGPLVAEAYRSFGQTLASLGMHIQMLSLSPRRAWRLKTVDGLEIALGRSGAEPHLQRFVQQYPNLTARLGAAPAYVDLRYADGFAVKLPAATKISSKQS